MHDACTGSGSDGDSRVHGRRRKAPHILLGHRARRNNAPGSHGAAISVVRRRRLPKQQEELVATNPSAVIWIQPLEQTVELVAGQLAAELVQLCANFAPAELLVAIGIDRIEDAVVARERCAAAAKAAAFAVPCISPVFRSSFTLSFSDMISKGISTYPGNSLRILVVRSIADVVVESIQSSKCA